MREYALEIVNVDARLQLWFGRTLDFELGNLKNSQLDYLPRVVTSRSQDTQNTDSLLMSKREFKYLLLKLP